jgi:hypothetical protein
MKSPHTKNTLLKKRTSQRYKQFYLREYFFSHPRKLFSHPSFLINLFSLPTGFVSNRTDIASYVNTYGQSVCKLDTTHLQTDRRASANKGLKEMAGEVVNQTFVHLINSCGMLTVRASKPPLL